LQTSPAAGHVPTSRLSLLLSTLSSQLPASRTQPSDNHDSVIASQSSTLYEQDSNIDQSSFNLATQPILRIGLLGLGDKGLLTVTKLVHLLLADPLHPEPAKWEDELFALSSSTPNTKPVLIRYKADEEYKGDQISYRNSGTSSLYTVIYSNSTILKEANVEILLTRSDNLQSSQFTSVDESIEDILVPVIQHSLAGSITTGGFVRLPLHKAIIVGKGLDGAFALSTWNNIVQKEDGKQEHGQELVEVVLDSNIEQNSNNDIGDKEISMVDLEKAEKALERFRRDVKAGPEYADIWLSSGMNSLVKRILSPSRGHATSSLHPLVRRGISSILELTNARITSARSSSQSRIQHDSVPEHTRLELQAKITEWSEFAHSELGKGLDESFSSLAWRRTSFPRILWRTDDVSISTIDILRSYFLVESQAYLAYISGSIGQAGFDFKDILSIKPDTTDQRVEEEQKVKSQDEENENVMPRPDKLLITEKFKLDMMTTAGTNILLEKPWPISIEIACNTIRTNIVPDLHVKAQKAVLQCYGGIGIFSALGGWYIAATAGTGIYEAGAVVALGIVLSLRRLQKYWNRQRDEFESEMRECGRLAITEAEGILRCTVRDARRSNMSSKEMTLYDEAEAAVRKCQDELENI